MRLAVQQSDEDVSMAFSEADFIHPNHLSVFISAARSFNCHILVRKTGRAALHWVGKRGYTGKRADMKAKTANQSAGRYHNAGLVCSPFLLPGAFSPDRLASAYKEWGKCQHLITVPKDTLGFDEQRQTTGCRTPYVVQSNPANPRYGCVALVDMGLLVPRYVHGDYDLYAIIPAGKSYDPAAVEVRSSTLGSTMAPDALSMQEKINLSVPNLQGPLSFKVANQINLRVASMSPDLLGSLMVNHGEQVNIGPNGLSYEPVLAVRNSASGGSWTEVLLDRQAHERFYRNA
ncbi:MAG: hypothetical protein ACI87W_000904 [Halieaceae bacterium]